MNRYAPKSDFLKRRAIDLYRSGNSLNEVARMLQVARFSVQQWTKDERSKLQLVKEAVETAERLAASREPRLSDLPTLAFVPHIELTPNSKYTMELVNGRN